MVILIVLARVALFVLGAVLTYVCFLYEDEELSVQSRLEDWWVKLDDKSDRALGRQTIFVQGVAKSVDRILTKFFGEELVSVRSIAVSVCYSIGASLLLIGVQLLIVSWALPSIQSELPPFVRFIIVAFASDFYLYLLPGLSLLLVGSIPAVWPKLSWLSATIATLAVVANEWIMLSYRFRTGIASSEGGVASEAHLVLALPLSTLSDLYVLTLTRRVLKKSTEATTLKYALGLLGLAALAFLLVVCVPIATYYSTQLIFFATLAIMNLPSGALLTAFVAVSLLLLGHRAAWPAILRPIYAAQRVRLLSNRKLVLPLGVACFIAASTPSFTEAAQLLQKAVKSIVH